MSTILSKEFLYLENSLRLIIAGTTLLRKVVLLSIVSVAFVN